MANAADVLAQFANLPIGTPISDWRVATPQTEALNQEAYNAAAAEAAGVPYTPKIIDTNPLSAPISRAIGSGSFANDKNSYRTDAQSVGDMISSVLAAPVSMVGGIAATGLGVVNNGAGVWAAQTLNDFNESVRDNQSAGLNNARRAVGAMDLVTSENNETIYQTERNDYGDFRAKLRREGRNVLSGISNATSNSAVFSDGLANAVGSLAVGGPLAKGAGLVGSKILGGLLSRGVISEAAAIQATKFGSAITMPATIGATEAGATYQQTVQQVADMSHEQLMQTSPEYAELVASDPGSIELRTQAKNEIANSAGLLAAAIQFPAAAATGVLVSKFERSPFKIPTSAGSAAGNMLREGTEEFVQSGAGQLASNVGIGQYADSNQDILSGVGQQAGLGALYGIGSAGVAQAPGLAIRGAVGTAKAGAKAAVAAGSAIAQPFIDRLSSIQAGRESSSQVSSQNLNTQVQGTLDELPTINAQVQQDAADNKLTPDTANLIQEHLTKLDQTMRFDPTTLDTLPISDELKGILGKSANQFEALTKAAEIASQKIFLPQDRIDAAIYINDVMGRVGPQMTDALVKAMEPLADEDTQYLPKLRQYDDLLYSFQQNPEIIKALAVAQKFVANLKAENVSAEAVATPKGQQAVRGIVSLAESDPGAISGDLADLVLEHARNGRYTLNTNQTRALNAAKIIARVGQTYVLRAKKLQIKPIDIVNNEILNNEYDGATKELSAAGHAKAVMSAMRAGDTQTASEALIRMMKFAQHMSNKVGAFNENLAAGNGSEQNTTKFMGVTPNGKTVMTLKGVWINPIRPGSVGLAQRVSLEADALGNMANELALQMPELGVSPIEITKLNPDLEGPANEVASRFKEGQKPAANPVVEPAPTPTPAKAEETVKVDPAGKAQPKPEVKTESPAPKAEAVPEETFIPDVSAMTDSEIDLRLEDLANRNLSDLTKEERLTANAVRAEKASRAKAAPKVEAKDSVPENPLPPAKDSTKPESSVAEPEAEAAPVVEPVAEPTKAPATTAEAFPTLIGTKDGPVKNWFHRAFNMPKEARSRLLGAVSALGMVKDALASNDALKALLGTKLTKTLTADLVKAYGDYLGNVDVMAKAMSERLQTALNKSHSSGKTMAEALVTGLSDKTQVNELVDHKSFNIVEQLPDGTFAYNQKLLDGAILAGLQWLLGAANGTRTHDSESLASLLNVSETVAAEHVEWFNAGFPLVEAKRGIAESIVKYWGLQANPMTPDGYVKGIAESVAAEVIRGLEATKLLTYDVSEVRIGGKTYSRLLPGDNNEAVYESLSAYPTAIEEAVLVEPDNVNFIGTPPTKPATNQLHNSPVKLSDQQREAIETAQNTPSTVNTLMLSFLEMLGSEGVVALFGKGNPTQRGINVNTAKSINGFNRTLSSAFGHLNNLISEMRNHAKTAGTDLAGVPVFFRYGISSVGRLQMEGRASPQGSKLVREVLLSTGSTLDLSNTQSDHYRAFMLAVAQHLGEKVHKEAVVNGVNQAMTKAVDNLGDKYADIVELFGEWQAAEKTNEPLKFEQADIDLVREKLGSDLSPGAVHAIMEYTRYLNSTVEERAAFKTQLYLEADGVTDGPVNAHINLTTGEFTDAWLDVANRGGLYTGSAPISLNEYVNQQDQTRKPSEDLYQVSTNNLFDELVNVGAAISDNAALKSLNSDLWKVLRTFLKDVAYNHETKQITFKRGIAKSPMTVTVYGSGILGIASKITAAALEEMYQQLSDGVIIPIEVQQAVARLGSNKVTKKSGVLGVQNVGDRTNKNVGSGTNFTITSDMVSNMETAVMHLFASPLSKAIGQIMGPALDTAGLIRQATQTQSIFFKYAFRQAIADALVNKDGTVSKDFLSRQDLDQIFNNLIKDFPMIDTGTQMIWVGGSERSDLETSEFGRDHTGGLRTNGYVYGPENAGVSGIPYIVISTGDGQMVLNALTGQNVPQGILPVFDGMNMKLDTIKKDSARINQAVYDGWMRNPVRAVQESFTKFWKAAGNVSSADMNEEMVEELVKALRPDLSPEESIEILEADLRDAADSLDARKAVLAKINMSVDHMASASAPYVKSDGIELPADRTEAVAKLNEMYREEFAKIRKNKATQVAADVEVSEDLTSFLDTVGATDETGAKVIGRDDVRSAMRELNIPQDQKSLLRASINALATKGWNVIHGTAEQLVAFGQARNIKLPSKLGNGLALPGFKTVFLLAANSETLSHEMLHAATIEQIHAYYVDPNSVAPAAREAIKRIELLMQEFLGLDTKRMDPETLNAFQDVMAAIEQIDESSVYEPAVQKAARLNEFMAWTLANQKLAQLAKENKVKSPLARIAAKALELLKKLWRAGLMPNVGEDIYSNLRFNTLTLMQTKPAVYGNASSLASLAQFHAPNYGSSDYLTSLELQFTQRLANVTQALRQNNPGAAGISTVARVSAEHLALRNAARRVRASFQANGFGMTQQEASLFETMITAFGIDSSLDPNVQSRMQEVFNATLEAMKVEDFMADPLANDPNDRVRAEAKLNLINGKYYVGQDALGRSTLLPAFVALATVNDQFRAVLAKIDVPATVKASDGTFDGWVANAGETMMERLAKAFSNESNKPESVLSAMNLMTDRLAESDIDQANIIEQHISPIGNGIDKANDWFVNLKDDYTQRAADALDNVRQSTTKPSVKLATNVAEAVLGIFNEDIGNGLAMAGQSILDKTKLWKAIPELWSEVIGRTAENAPIFDMIKKSRAFIQQLRQAYRNQLPNVIGKEFSRALTKQEWGILHDTMMTTDLAVLIPLGSDGVLELLRDGRKVQTEITRLERTIARLDPAQSALLLQKSEELATYMNTKRHGGNLLRNAEAIANLLGELPDGIRRRRGNPDPRLISAIDQLTSLYALKALPTEIRTAAAELAANESQGLAFTLEYLVALREAELSKAWTQRAKLNHYKGFAPGETKAGASLIVADARDHADLLARGYVRVGTYMGSTAEGPRFARAYYFAPLSGKASFNQGIAQNIRHTFYGVDPTTGFSTDTFGAGRITEQRKVAQIKAQRGANNSAVEPLMPIFDHQGDVVAYERSVDPIHIAKLERETDLTKVMGIWRGRQIEEASSDSFNNELVGKLYDLWTNESVGRRDEYVNLLDPADHKDPVITDAVKLLSPNMMREIEATFGADGFMVKKSMINDAIGYRSPSIGDLWTGNTRIDPNTAKVASDVLTAIIGKDAFKYLVTGEKLWQNFVADARTTIVVKSVIVPAANILSNIYQLSARGVPLAQIIKGMPRKLAEVQAFHKNRLREIELEAQILAAKNNLPRLNALKTEMRSIQDSYRRLSIWPLIQAGEFSSVAEGIVSKEETTLFEGKLNQYIEGLTDKLPDGLKTAGKYAIVSKDTALFQGLQKAVEYGDFLAKAVLYDDLVKRKKMSSSDALVRIGEEYVNFDRLPGRFRGALEANGLLWFWHFKLRSIKVGLSIIRNNPLHALLTGLAPTPDIVGTVGSPITDNAIGVWYNGKLHYSLGIMQGIHAHSLNPTVNFLT